MLKQFCSFYLHSVMSNIAICVRVTPRRCKWTPPNEKLRKDLEARKRWREENTKLFGPILKTKKFVPLGKKGKRRKTEKIVIGKDLDDWFNENYESKVPNTDFLNGPSDQGLKTTEWTGRVSSHEYVSETHTGTGVVSSEKGSDEGKDKSVLNYIMKCNITADSSTQQQSLQSCLQRSPFPTRPTVTGILAKTRSPESQFYLDRWKAQKIAELGEDGFKRYQTETLQRGVDLHDCIQQYLSGVASIQPRPDNTGHWSSVQEVLIRVTEVQAMETRVTHPYLNYAGTFDCVATYRGTVCLIDWKTSQKAKPHLSSTFDYPLQVCAYIGAYNANPDHQVKLENGLVVVAYGDGSPAHAHLMTREQCEYYWRQWLDKLYQYWSSVLFPDCTNN